MGSIYVQAQIKTVNCSFTIGDPPVVPGLVLTQVHTDTRGVRGCSCPLSETWRDPQGRGHVMDIYEFRSTFDPQVHLRSSAQLTGARVQQGDVVPWGSQGDTLSRGGKSIKRRVCSSRFSLWSVSTTSPVQTVVQPSDDMLLCRERLEGIPNRTHYCQWRNSGECVCVSVSVSKCVVDRGGHRSAVSNNDAASAGCPETVFVCSSDQMADSQRGHMICRLRSLTYLCIKSMC